MVQAQPAQQLQAHQMLGPVPAAVVALGQASSTPIILKRETDNNNRDIQQSQRQTTITETDNRLHTQISFM